MIEAAIAQYLKNQSTITSLVGQRILPNWIPQSNNQWPVVTLTLISNVHDHCLSGAAGSAQARIQIDIWGKVPTDVVKLAEQIRFKLHGYSGIINYNDPAARTIQIFFIELDDERNLNEAPEDGSDTWTFRRSVDYLVRYREAVPTF